MLRLLRVIYAEHAVFGYLIHPSGLTLCTVERPWLRNIQNVSCIPDGLYILKKHSTERYPNTWALINEPMGIYHQPAPGAHRSAILIHVGNTASDLEGCIAVGTGFHFFPSRGAMGVKESVTAMTLLRQAMAKDPMAGLVIKSLPESWHGQNPQAAR